jgi:peptidyl-prolyl cis-trans isomerase D
MFDAVRNNKRIVQVFLGLIILPFAFWGVDSYVRDAGAGIDLAKVGESKVTQNDFQEAMREQQDALRKNLREQYDPALLDSPAARRAVLEQLVNQRLLLAEAQELKVVVSDQALRDFIAGIPALQEGGKFSLARYENVLREQGLSQVGFEHKLRRELVLNQLASMVGEASFVSKTVAESIHASMAEKRTVQEFRINAEAFLAQAKVSDEDLQKEYEANRKQFEEPEQARVEFVELSINAIKAKVKVSEAEVKAWYDGHQANYQQPEERRASHILIAAEASNAAARAQAKAKAEALLAQVKAKPADFGKLAKEHSQDPGSAANDGDLGFFGRGSMVKAFDETVFALKDKEISGVVETEFGYHIIQLTGIHAGKGRAFEEVKGEIEAELKAQAAQKQYAEAAEAFANIVYEQSDSLKGAVEKFGLPLQQTGWIVKGAPAVPGTPFANPKLAKVLFSDDVVKNKRNTEAVEIAPSTLVSARIVEYKPMAVKPLESVKGLLRDRLLRKQAGELAVKAGEAKLAEVRAGKESGVTWAPPQSVARSAPGTLSGEAVKAVFAVSSKTLPSYAGVALRSGAYAIYRVSAVDASAKLPVQTADAVTQELASVQASEAMAVYLASLRGKHKVTINTAALEAK